MIEKHTMIKITRDIVYQLFNHGWAEDYQHLVDCTDPQDLKDIIEAALVKGHIEDLNLREGEEYDWQYDDGGLVSFIHELGLILKKHNVVNLDRAPVKQVSFQQEQIIKEYYLCPHCSRKNYVSKSEVGKQVFCGSCQNPVEFNGN